MKKLRNQLFIKAYFELSVHRKFVKKNIVFEPCFIGRDNNLIVRS